MHPVGTEVKKLLKVILNIDVRTWAVKSAQSYIEIQYYKAWRKDTRALQSKEKLFSTTKTLHGTIGKVAL